ncbi:MAG TPA: hypothetical protein VFR94_01385 [Nitrososphaeraceae archaeon]|nr:hypothetical protein [Nitrososphaeraceae archaeon]
MPRPPKDNDKVKTKNVKVSEECHRLIGRMGFVYEEFGEVVFRAMKHYMLLVHVLKKKKKVMTNNPLQRPLRSLGTCPLLLALGTVIFSLYFFFFLSSLS